MSHEDEVKEERVLVLAPTSADRQLTRSILTEAAIDFQLCADLDEVVHQLGESVEAVLLTDDALFSAAVRPLVKALESQPPWSDLPIILLSATGDHSRIAAWTIERLGNVTVLERPVRLPTLVSALRSAIRARRRQYELRDQLQALRESECIARRHAAELEAIMETVPAIVFLAHDSQCNRVTGSRTAYEFLRVPPGANLSKSTLSDGTALPFRIYHEGRELSAQELPVQRAARGESVTSVEIEHRFPDGESITIFGNAVPLRDELGNLRGAVAAFIDVTDHKRTEAALREGDRRKDEFLAMLAHELRNPLAPIRTGLQVVQLCGDDHKTAADTLQMMDRQLQQLVRLIDDLLDISRITRGKIELRREPSQLGTILSMAIEASRPVIEAAGVEFSVSMSRQDIELDADPARLSQVFSNLLSNAAKYTDRGGHVWLSAERRESEVIVVVRDSGIGIRPEMLSQIFDMFTQVDKSERSYGGLGIGLSLVRAFVHLHGGSVEAYSGGPGQGSEFKVRLPVVRCAKQLRPPAPGPIAQHTETLRILVVDDNVDAAKSLALMLRLMRHEVQMAHDGLEATSASEAFRPDIVLLDLGMPKLNGYEAARRIRQQPWGDDITLVALTGWGQDEDRRRSSDAGFDAHLVKPVDRDALEALLTSAETKPVR